jgi:hypothetical protein
MRFVSSSHSPVIHAADCDLRPLCGQTTATRREIWQADIGPCSCRRCRQLLRAIYPPP